ncbi:MFS transporter [Cohnella cholangitidis]|uniref:MFS transporter n=2 Tax=Cohnella cholangitidis TaxID=2598458 RepID=A0A7G5C7A3_9BACL|nr:MFS transporter [Cohnella cholangitidis]
MPAATGIGAGQSLVRNRTFMWVLSGNTISVFGDCFNGIALSLWILQKTGSAKSMAAVLMTHMILSLLFGSVAGTVADRMDRRKLMLIADASRCVIVAVLAILVFYVDVPFPAVIAMVALLAITSLFQAPAFHASINPIVGKDRQQQATGWIHLTDNVARISGLATAGILISAFGGFVALLCNSLAYFLSMLCVLAAGKFPAYRSAESKSTTFVNDLKEGFRFIASNALAKAIVVLHPLLILFFMSSLTMVQVMAVKEWRAGPVAFGFIELCIPLGYMIGASLILSLGSRIGRRGIWICAGLLLLGPMFYLLSAMRTVWPALPFVLGCGLLFAFSTMLIQIILRSEVSVELQGRLYGAMGALSGIAPPLGLAVFSSLADHYGASWTLSLISVLFLAVGITVTVTMKQIRTYS